MAKKVIKTPEAPIKKEVKLTKEQSLLVENCILKQQLIQTSIGNLQKDFQEVSNTLSDLLINVSSDAGGEYINRSFNTEKGTIQVAMKPEKKK